VPLFDEQLVGKFWDKIFLKGDGRTLANTTTQNYFERRSRMADKGAQPFSLVH
jgi:hypothetical protein